MPSRLVVAVPPVRQRQTRVSARILPGRHDPGQFLREAGRRVRWPLCAADEAEAFEHGGEHEPVHVHGKREGRESKAELIYEEGRLKEIVYREVRGKQPLSAVELANFRDLVEDRADDIVQKWVDFFVLHKTIVAERITRRVR